jgi:hypothetical protein
MSEAILPCSSLSSRAGLLIDRFFAKRLPTPSLCKECTGCVHKRVKGQCKFCGTGAYCGRCHKKGRKWHGECPHGLNGAPPVRWVSQIWNPATQQVLCTSLRRKSLRRRAPWDWTVNTWPDRKIHFQSSGKIRSSAL